MSIITAALQFTPAYMDVQRNADFVAASIRSIEADFYVVPELCTTGYFFRDRAQALELAETADGPFCMRIGELAAERNAVIIAGFDERDGERIYNSAVIAKPDGTRRVYRKIHLFAEEKIVFTPGDTGFFVMDHEGITFGTMICYDWRFPEAVRTLALKGAQIVFHPSNLVALPAMWGPVMQTRSLENKIFTVTANRTGAETRGSEELVFHGCSQITAHNGSILAQADEGFAGWITAEFDPARALNKSFSKWNDIFTDRRPETYEL